MTCMGKKRNIALLALATILAAALLAGCTSSPAVKKGDNVTIDYVINTTDGRVLQTSYAQLARDLGIYDSTWDYAPYSFVVGSNSTIVGIDEAAVGMKVNDTKTVTVPPEKSFGAYNRSLVLPVHLSTFAALNITPHVNDTLQVPPYLNFGRVDSIDAANDTVYMDYNRPHAGETLVIQIIVRKIE